MSVIKTSSGFEIEARQHSAGRAGFHSIRFFLDADGDLEFDWGSSGEGGVIIPREDAVEALKAALSLVEGSAQ